MAKKKKKKRSPAGSKDEPLIPIVDVPLHVTTRRRYLNYAMSVITSRALPDVRDGLKPVQRRILYTMRNELRLGPSTKPLKCARIVGDVLGKFHPHGDSSVYEALVRMAQDFSLRYPLVDGHGNFGSIDGDSAAAYRYTEARLQKLAIELLEELPKETVDFRPNYDGKTREPIVLPSRIPNLLINGATGIAVGMATNIPPHNLAEVTEACEALVRKRRLKVNDLLKFIKGPDFPTGGQILNTRREISQIYRDGHGSVKVRGEYKLEGGSRKPRIVITSIPYMVQKDVLVRSIGELIGTRKIPQINDVRDESTTDIRIVLEMKQNAEPDVVMAYLFKNTNLQNNFNVNLTCLVPSSEEDPDRCKPARLDLRQVLLHFIRFRYKVVVRRLEHELRLLKERIHILEGFKKIFNALDTAIKIIRNSNGREDAAKKLKKRFRLDDIQVNAILDLRLYKLAKLEIKAILDELRDKKKRAREIEKILKSDARLWTIVRKEIAEVRKSFTDGRRTKIGGKGARETEYSEEAFIVNEDAIVLLSRDGWVKRMGRITDLEKVRLRQGDELLSVVGGNTRDLVVFFSNLGSAYTIRINDLPASTGYGDPVQGIFKFRDGERAIGAMSLDSRFLTDVGSVEDTSAKPPLNHLLAVSSGGYALRCSLAAFTEPSTRTGRKFMRVRGEEEVVGTHVVQGKKEVVMVASQEGRVTLFKSKDVKFLTGPGRGVLGIKLAANDRLIASGISTRPSDRLRVFTTKGAKIDITTRKYKVSGRGGKGIEVIKRGGLSGSAIGEHEIPVFDENGDSPGAKSPAKKRTKKRAKKKAAKTTSRGGGRKRRKTSKKTRKK
ncbi:MAG: DNA topoisomerase IV subunit A [Planctomycetota bacterium]|nr:DNA topoisomerase IV subunit A [Planctomycetota bacterium]